MTLCSIATLILQFLSLQCRDNQAEIIFAGDAMQHAAQIEAARMVDGSYDYSDCFTAIAQTISDADYAVVNLETPLGGKPYRGYPCFSAPDSYAQALKDAGFDLFLTANNHTLDCLDRGLVRTVNLLDSLGMPHIGTYPNLKYRQNTLPHIEEIKGFKVAFLNYTYGTNGIQPRNPDTIVDYIDRATIKQDIENARKQGAEIVCASIHWGEEYKLLPEKSQKNLAEFLKANGVDIIFGGHPHVIQPMELTHNPVTQRNTALIYSLGNFISNMKTRDTRGGAIAKVTLSRDSVGTAHVSGLSYRLIFVTPPSGKGDNFRVVFAEDSVPLSMQSHRNAFVKAAQDIFNRYNVNVSPWTK